MKKYHLLLLLFIPIICDAQTTIRNLVFEGAGIRGIAYAGVLSELEKNKLHDSIEKVAGTSAGGITALTFALGYKSDEIAKLISETDFEKFNDGQYLFFGGFYRMGKKFGWYKTDAFVKWLEHVIAVKTGNPNITFAEFHQQGYKELYITAISLNKQRTLVFSRHSYPNMRIKDAVRITMSVPLYFEAICIDSTGSIIEKPMASMNYDLVVDGGITFNFPISIFDSMVNNNGKLIRVANPHTVGVRIDTDEQIAQDTTNKQLAVIEIKTLSDYINAFYTYTLENLNRQALIEEDWQRTISVSSIGITPKVKRLSMAQKQALLLSGQKSAERYFQKR